MISVAYYARGRNTNGKHCNPVSTISTIRYKDKKRIQELINELSKYGVVYEEEDCRELQTKLHLIVKVPYKEEIIRK